MSESAVQKQVISIPEWLQIALPALIVLISRLPFLFNGYGAEEDSWGLVINAREMSAVGHYTYARLPGHPVQEFALSLLPFAGPFLFNFLSALFSAVAVVFFVLILKHYGFKDKFPAALALAMIPVCYISSVYTIDYCWALAFIMASVYAALKNKAILSGVLLGIAIGCRLTSAVMLIPLLLIFWGNKGNIPLMRIFMFGLFLSLTTILVYLAPLIEYGFQILDTYKLPYPPLPKVLYKGSLGVFGVIGFIALLYAIIVLIRHRAQPSSESYQSVPRLHKISWVIVILLHLMIYIRLPEKSAFLLPAIPFIILSVQVLMRSRRAFRIFCLMWILSPFLLSVNLTDPYRGAGYSRLAITRTIAGQQVFFDVFNGPIFSDFTKRKNKEVFTKNILAGIKKTKRPSLIICGWWYNEVKVSMQDSQISGPVSLTEFATEEALQEAREQGTDIYYLYEIDRINDLKYNGKYTANYARLWY